MTKPGRNQMCACGSGKKYKHCCGLTASGAELTNRSEAELIALSIEHAKDLHQKGDLALALQLYESVLAIQPAHPDALHFSGLIAYQHKNYAVAERLMSRSIAEDPNNAFYFSNLGVLYKDLGSFQRAVECQQKALQLKPEFPGALLNLGAAFLELKQYDHAENCFRKALALQPNFVEAHDNLGTALTQLCRYSEAEDCFNTAIQLNPNYVLAYVNLAAVSIYVKQFDVVVENSLKALELDANCASAYYYLGIACVEQDRYPEADQFLRHAVELDPENADIHLLLGKLNLALGNLAQGWTGYEYRWLTEIDPVVRRHYSFPEWSGESLDKKTILVWAEQGIGDQIMFASMYGDLIRLAEHCIFACAKKLVPLFSSSFPQAIVVDVEDREILNKLDLSIDVQSAAGSLARWIRPDVDSFPRRDYFLSVDPDRVNYWKNRLKELGPGLKVGIGWRSGNMTGERAYYCSAIDQWSGILSLPGIRFINLQYDDCSIELAKIYEDTGIAVHVFDEVDLFDDMVESAALTCALDFVISGGTATGILSAALGVPTWMLLSGFEWQSLGTGSNCWYGRLHTVRKTWEQAWEVSIEHVAAQLRSKIPPQQ